MLKLDIHKIPGIFVRCCVHMQIYVEILQGFYQRFKYTSDSKVGKFLVKTYWGYWVFSLQLTTFNNTMK